MRDLGPVVDQVIQALDPEHRQALERLKGSTLLPHRPTLRSDPAFSPDAERNLQALEDAFRNGGAMGLRKEFDKLFPPNPNHINWLRDPSVGRTPVKSNETPAVRSRPDSSSTSRDSREQFKRAVEELKDWVKHGHAKLAPGNELLSEPRKAK